MKSITFDNIPENNKSVTIEFSKQASILDLSKRNPQANELINKQELIQTYPILQTNNTNNTRPENNDLKELELRRKLEQLETKKANEKMIEEQQQQQKIDYINKYMSE